MEIKRDRYVKALVDARQDGLVKVITGPRRCGKSYLLTRLFHNHLREEGFEESQIIEISLEDRTNDHLRNPDSLLEYIKDNIRDDRLHFVIIDEVQFVDEFVDVLNSLLHIPNVDAYVTGSNSKFLSSDIATEFRGRDHQIRIYPLTFSEFYSAFKGEVSSAWKEYFTYGSLPQVAIARSDDAKVSLLNGIFETAYMSDIKERYRIKNDNEMQKLVRIMASGIGSPTNPSRISNTFKSVENVGISSSTIENYLSYLTDAFLLSKADRYDLKGKKYIGTLSKYYFEDLGIRNAILNFRQTEENHLMENVIYNELRYRGYNVDIGNIASRGIDKNGKNTRNYLEIDFVANKASSRYYIQSVFDMVDSDKIAQETRSFMKIQDSFKKIVVQRNETVPWHNEQGITFISLFDFLLNPNSLEL